MRYLMDIQHYNSRLYYKKGTLHVDADAVSRLLKLGEQPQYLDKDSLEWDKGPVTDDRRCRSQKTSLRKTTTDSAGGRSEQTEKVRGKLKNQKLSPM